MSDIHDFWRGKTGIPPGLKPALRRGAGQGMCIPVRNRITGSYQPPAPVWTEPQRQPLPLWELNEQPAEEGQRQVVVNDRFSRFDWLEIGGFDVASIHRSGNNAD